MSRVLTLAGGVAGLVLLCAACTPHASPGRNSLAPAEGPVGSSGQVTTGRPVTVIDDGSGAELCLDGVLESYPPQCTGPKLAGWTWADLEGHFEEAQGVRWGEFLVTGHYDQDTDVFNPSDVQPR